MSRTPEHTCVELLQVSNLREYFRNSVDDAMESNSVTADHHTSHYVVNLLTLFARAEPFNQTVNDADGRKPLALMLADALDAPTAEQRCIGLQKLGDAALFLAGFFADDLEDSVVDMDYYVSMGGNAYSSLSMETRGTVRGRAFGMVFAELGDKFQQFVDVLNDVRNSSGSASDIDLMRQYELWMKTGSRRARRLLREQGVVPLVPPSAERRH